MRRWDPINPLQLRLLTRIADGEELDVSGERLATSLYALRNRGLIDARRRKGEWSISITDAGKHYLLHGHHPARPDKTQEDRGDGPDAGPQTTPVTLPTDAGGKPSPATHDIGWMADQIGMSTDWIGRHRHEIPHHLIGSRLRFTDKDLATYLDPTAWRPQRMVTTGPRRRVETTDRPWPMQTTGRPRRVY
jgi:hypothetical protein